MRTLQKDYYRQLEKMGLGELLKPYVVLLASCQSRTQVWEGCDLFAADCQVTLRDRKVMQDIWSSLNEGRQFHNPERLDSARLQWLINLAMPDPDEGYDLSLVDYYLRRIHDTFELVSEDELAEFDHVYFEDRFGIKWADSSFEPTDVECRRTSEHVLLTVRLRCDVTRRIVDEILGLAGGDPAKKVTALVHVDYDPLCLRLPRTKEIEETMTVNKRTEEIRGSRQLRAYMTRVLADSGLSIKFVRGSKP